MISTKNKPWPSSDEADEDNSERDHGDDIQYFVDMEHSEAGSITHRQVTPLRGCVVPRLNKSSYWAKCPIQGKIIWYSFHQDLNIKSPDFSRPLKAKHI